MQTYIKLTQGSGENLIDFFSHAKEQHELRYWKIHKHSSCHA